MGCDEQRELRSPNIARGPESWRELYTAGLARPLFLNFLPQSLQIRCSEGTIVEPVAWSAGLAPKHSSMVRPNRPREASPMQRVQHGVHVRVAEVRRMPTLTELPLTHP